ncbi:FAD/NAD-P-binding domain-containing protein [Athelia psychrophila]|uniref:FAD/NAD-P-binding domain-containing protein n=1 Tax=Athelia psychrophila TaxID=1759441 RepID=A0A166UA93_9AGAM|nr:FAD/NAD-P-binding domain-containing protein [Fibularhizoctonia sp. CBS 109695]
MSTWDCIVIGSGHAGSCAALSAAQNGCAKVLIIDKCPKEWVGGNGYFTAGAHRTAHNGLADLLPILTNVPPDAAARIEMQPYTAAEFAEDIMRLGEGLPDEALVKTVVEGSRDAIEWLATHVGVPFTLSFNRQAYEVDGKSVFWGGMVLSVEDGGKGLIGAHRRALVKAGIATRFDTRAVEVLSENGRVCGVVVETDGKLETLRAKAVVLAAGGFEANAEMRGQHLGPAWKQARVRGTPYNTGDGFVMARALGVKMVGDWSGCHSTAWDANAQPDSGDREMSNQFTKSGYPLGIMVNTRGERFVDEGEDFRNYTYAKFGHQILQQPGGCVFQIFDKKVLKWLREEEYADDVVAKVWADSVEELAEKLAEAGLQDQKRFIETLSTFNQATRKHQEQTQVQWNPAVKDGLSTGTLLDLPKSNWALPVDEAPFMAVKVACGITFTFGGLGIDPGSASVLSDATGEPIEGLFCTGEMVGGLFFKNYPGGSGLTAGAVFGRKAGYQAAQMRIL